MYSFTKRKNAFYDNNNSALIPQLWANEGLLILEDNIVAAGLVNRQYDGQVASYGETVNAWRPNDYEARRKTDSDNVTTQDAVTTQIPVTLNQWHHVSFIIKDGEASKSFKDLVMIHLEPTVKSLAKVVDQAVLGQYGRFMANSVGKVGLLSSTNVKQYYLETRQKLNENKAPDMDRRFIWTPASETQALMLDSFTEADKLGDGGLAMRSAAMGRKFGYDNYMSQNAASVPLAATDKVVGAINAGNLTAGSTVLTVDNFSAAIGNGSWLTVAGAVHRVVSTSGGSTPVGITITPALRYDILNDDVVTVFDPAAINLADGYASGWVKAIKINGFTNMPNIGQMVSFGTSATAAVYTIIQRNTTDSTITLDRPLEAALSNSDVVNIGPNGNYNFAFHKDAIGLISRPLALPMSNLVSAAVVPYKDLSLRVVITYDGQAQGHRVTVDLLFGVAVFNTNLGAVLVG